MSELKYNTTLKSLHHKNGIFYILLFPCTYVSHHYQDSWKGIAVYWLILTSQLSSVYLTIHLPSLVITPQNLWKATRDLLTAQSNHFLPVLLLLDHSVEFDALTLLPLSNISMSAFWFPSFLLFFLPAFSLPSTIQEDILRVSSSVFSSGFIFLVWVVSCMSVVSVTTSMWSWVQK